VLNCLRRLATNKVSKGYGGNKASAINTSSTFSTSTSTIVNLAPAGPNPPVMATSAGAKAAGARALSKSSRLTMSNNPRDLMLVGQPYIFASLAENQKPYVSNINISNTTIAAKHVFPKV
jgi:hypothetical protein